MNLYNLHSNPKELLWNESENVNPALIRDTLSHILSIYSPDIAKDLTSSINDEKYLAIRKDPELSELLSQVYDHLDMLDYESGDYEDEYEDDYDEEWEREDR